MKQAAIEGSWKGKGLATISAVTADQANTDEVVHGGLAAVQNGDSDRDLVDQLRGAAPDRAEVGVKHEASVAVSKASRARVSQTGQGAS